MPEQGERETETVRREEAPDSAGVRTVNCPACGVQYDAALDSCPRCGAPAPGHSEQAVFPMEVGRFPRPWKAFPAAYQLLRHPRRTWPAISPSGKRLHAATFCLCWALTGVIGFFAALTTGGARLIAWVEFLPVVTGIMLALQAIVHVVVRISCMLWWIPGSKARASAYSAGLVGLSMCVTFLLFSCVETSLDHIPVSMTLFNVVKISAENAAFALLLLLPNGLLQYYALFGFYRWRVGLGRWSTLFLSVVPPSVFMLAVCFYFAQPRILRQ